MSDHRDDARQVLEGAWDPYRGYCYPNRNTYPHLWLWDSCFHAVAWAGFGDARAPRELGAVFDAQLSCGFVPHMRYSGPTIDRGPLPNASSFTQPPMYAHAARCIAAAGLELPPLAVDRIGAGLAWLWERRLGEDGLLLVYHPWESGADDSPRWDSWVGTSDWERMRWTAFDFEALGAVEYDPCGVAAGSTLFAAAPAAFNALAAHAALELAALGGGRAWQTRGERLVAAIDGILWDPKRGHWVDLAVVGGGPSVAVPTLDGLMPALVTDDASRAMRALDQAGDGDRFAAPYGLRYVAADHPSYQPGGYWRGSAWMQMNYLCRLAALRWGDDVLAGQIRDMSIAGSAASGFAEHWHAETGEPLGAVPQTWSALVATMD